MLDAGLYVGRVMHHRIRPKRHRFVYRLFTLLVDIDRLHELDRRLRLLSLDRINLFSFYNEDHGPRDGTALRPWVEAGLGKAGIMEKPDRILLLAMPRLLGYVFNPLSIYYCYDALNRLYAIVYEVKNTFGGQHPYVIASTEWRNKSQRLRHSRDKNFYVSPFIQADANYKFNINEPNENLDVRITVYVGVKALLVAVMQGQRRPLTDRQLLIQALRNPFLPQKVTLAIHFEALKLWLKGISLQPRPVGK